jgi:DNA-binding transcriptional LysR family regulator
MRLCDDDENARRLQIFIAYCETIEMDRIDAMTAFIATAELGGFSLAARRLGRSPASITRAVAFLEERTGSQFLRRTTRVVKLTEAGERYLVACRQIIAELAAADAIAVSERESPRGVLSITAPLAFGRLHVRPLVDAFVEAWSDIAVRFYLLDRLVNVVDEGFDVAIRIAHLPDSSLVAVKVGEVRRVLCASPDYISRARAPREPIDLAKHPCISFSQVTPRDLWTFAAGKNGGKPKQARVRPRIVVNNADAAIASAVDGHGITQVLSYQVDRELRDGKLVRLLPTYEPDALPIHIVYPAASSASAKVRAFVDLATPRLKQILQHNLTNNRARR